MTNSGNYNYNSITQELIKNFLTLMLTEKETTFHEVEISVTCVQFLQVFVPGQVFGNIYTQIFY